MSELIHHVARGKHGSQDLCREDADFIFFELLGTDADPVQLGAFLIAQRIKGETSAELAGFVEAARRHIAGYGNQRAPIGAVDLPCYAGKRRAVHAHLAAALQARDAGVPVVVHGVEHIEGRITAWQLLSRHGVKRANSLAEAHSTINRDGIVYIDLAELCPALLHIYQLRPRLGVRTFANTVARLLNPMQCEGQLNGFFHTPYADQMSQANVLLGQPRSLVFMGAEGEPELYADRQKVVKMQLGAVVSDVRFADAGHEPYPRELIEQPDALLDQLLEAFEALLHLQTDSRESATVARMKNAFLWAAGKEALKNSESREVST